MMAKTYNPLRETQAETLAERVTALEQQKWTLIGTASGNADCQIPADVWDKVSEFLIVWRLTDNTPWRSILVPKSATRSLYVDAYQYSATYWGCFGFYVGLLDDSYTVTPSTGWTSGAWGATALNVNDLRCMLYGR